MHRFAAFPLPTPPPQGGREQTEYAARLFFILNMSHFTCSIVLRPPM